MHANIDVVRSVWAAFETGGLDAIADSIHPDSEWEPSSAGGRVLRGTEELREHFRALAATGTELKARIDALEEFGDTVLARGSLRVERWGSLSESTMVWTYELEDGMIVRARSHHSRAEALAAIGAAPAA